MMLARCFALVVSAFAATAATAQVACPEFGSTYTVARPMDLADDQTELYLGSNPGFGTTPITTLTTSSVTFQVPASGYLESFEVYYLIEPAGQPVTFSLLGAYTTCDDLTIGAGPIDLVDPIGPIDPVDPIGPVDPIPPVDPISPSTPIGSTAATSLAQARESFRAAQASRVMVRATSNEMAAPSGAPEILISGSGIQITKARSLVPQLGGVILRERSLGGLGLSMLAVDMQGALSREALLIKLAQGGANVTVGSNSLYTASGSRTYANTMVGGQDWDGCSLSRGLRIGLIDGPIDLSAPALHDVQISTQSVLGRADRSGSTAHATELATLIAGRPTDKTPAGLARGAHIYAAAAFMRYKGRNVASLEHLSVALDWMAARKVPLVNMSLAGPQNDTLTQVVSLVTRKGVIIVASTGNDALASVSFPAADPNVIAVTAVDANGRLFGKANRGPEVDFAAPGVDVLVPKKGGRTFRSGTSYSAAIATGIIAHELASGATSREAVMSRLRKHTTDLGQSGRDEAYGYGLIAISRCQK